MVRWDRIGANLKSSKSKRHYVYYLYLRRRVIYVGRSVDPEKRWRYFCRKHALKPKLVTTAVMLFDAARKLELFEIRRLQPVYNQRVASSPGMLGKTYLVTKEMGFTYLTPVPIRIPHFLLDFSAGINYLKYMEDVMTLLELQRHVNEAVAQNQSRGWENRNSMPVVIHLTRRTPTNQAKTRYFPVEQVYRGQFGLSGGEQFGLSMMVEEKNEVTATRPKHAFEASDIDPATCGKCGKVEGYKIHVDLREPRRRAFETAMGMHGFAGSMAEKEGR